MPKKQDSAAFVVFLAPVLLAAICGATSAIGNTVDSIGPLTDPTASESVKSALETKGYRVLLAEGEALCHLWFRSSVPVQPKADGPGVLYGEFSESTWLGVVSLPPGARDYRGQSIRAGSYTLRYALHPIDGNHLGVAPSRDFLLLAPLALDREVTSQFQFEELVKISNQASGTNHPAPLSLVTAGKPTRLPAVIEENGQIVLWVKLRTQSGSELPIGMVVKGVAEQ